MEAKRQKAAGVSDNEDIEDNNITFEDLGLDKLDIKELKELAKINHIDLTGISRDKTKIISRILESKTQVDAIAALDADNNDVGNNTNNTPIPEGGGNKAETDVPIAGTDDGSKDAAQEGSGKVGDVDDPNTGTT